MNLSMPLSDEETDELEKFLLSDAVSDDTMLLDCLDGYLTAIVIGPALVPPSRWLPGVWGPDASHAPSFQTMEQAQRIMELIMRHMNGIAGTLQANPDAFEPMLSTMQYPGDAHEFTDGEMWAHGFMDGVALSRVDWQPLFDDPAATQALRPIYLLGANEVTKAEERLVRWPKQREALSNQIAGAVAAIHRFWLPRRKAMPPDNPTNTVRHSAPKTGRNEPCPCGSGKKFKKCCGAATTIH